MTRGYSRRHFLNAVPILAALPAPRRGSPSVIDSDCVRLVGGITRRLAHAALIVETHRTVFTWVQQRLVEAGRLKGKTIAIRARRTRRCAALRRDTGESYQDLRRPSSARAWRDRITETHPHDPDARLSSRACRRHRATPDDDHRTNRQVFVGSLWKRSSVIRGITAIRLDRPGRRGYPVRRPDRSRRGVNGSGRQSA